MGFGDWQPLASAHPPEEPGILQMRAGQGSAGLRPYPKGKSAMVYYDADDATLVSALDRARLVGAAIGEPLYVRFAPSARPLDELARLLDTFVERFGAPPELNSQAPAKQSSD
jgi:hypothetical protein